MKIKISMMIGFALAFFVFQSCGRSEFDATSKIKEVTGTTPAMFLPRNTLLRTAKDITLRPRATLTNLVEKEAGRDSFGLNLWLVHPDSEDERVINTGTRLKVYEGLSENGESMILKVRTDGGFEFEISGYIWTPEHKWRSPTVDELVTTGFFTIEFIPKPVPIH